MAMTMGSYEADKTHRFNLPTPRIFTTPAASPTLPRSSRSPVYSG
jgi:hypothetical protein